MTAGTFSSGSDTVTINGTTGNETITGPNVASTIDGGAGTDTINGGAAADTIDGGADADTIDGGDGADSLTGGSGNDVYLFNTNDVDSGESITEASSGGTCLLYTSPSPRDRQKSPMPWSA